LNIFSYVTLEPLWAKQSLKTFLSRLNTCTDPTKNVFKHLNDTALKTTAKENYVITGAT
jgi:hypothetical protein